MGSKNRNLVIVQAAQRFGLSRQPGTHTLKQNLAATPTGWTATARSPTSTPDNSDTSQARIEENVLLLIQDNHVTTTNAATGDVIAEHAIDPSKNYQKPLSRTPGTPPHLKTTTRKTNPRKKS
ncbi:hypothetical protein GCM10010977_11620 [Citricoccus zhacaiensis]|uniref:Uncharacterized protein n=2 Tax=Citricoccus zhacaiensis TaxID=489142 RepID=A0ABQ2LVX4_9MICC|nr:hypothetical protein GCM10010977_11620 [Citricoccus zhacaiensis]